MGFAAWNKTCDDDDDYELFNRLFDRNLHRTSHFLHSDYWDFVYLTKSGEY